MSVDELTDLTATVQALLNQIDEFHETYDGALAELATLDWRGLAREGHLGTTPRLAIERTIEDARNVLNSGREAMALVLEQARDPEMIANPDLDIPGRLRAVIRLYSDTPNDLRNRFRRLTTWLTAIVQSQQQAEAPSLANRVAWPDSVPRS